MSPVAEWPRRPAHRLALGDQVPSSIWLGLCPSTPSRSEPRAPASNKVPHRDRLSQACPGEGVWGPLGRFAPCVSQGAGIIDDHKQAERHG